MNVQSEYIEYWMQVWCCSLSIDVSKYAAVKLANAYGFDFTYPLTDDEYDRAMVLIDQQDPELYVRVAAQPKPHSWILSLCDLEDVRLIRD